METFMKIKHFALIVVAAALPALAAAQEARSGKQINMRAGPARDYPLVASYGPGTPLAVQGCTDGYGWCDVIAPGNVRGWVFAGNILYPWQDQERPLQIFGSVVGIPIITFSIGNYWGSYYPNRPWYRDRDRWEHHAPPARPGPPVMRPPPAPRPPIVRPPADHRPPPVMRPPPPPAPRPPPAARPPEGHPPAGHPPEAGHPPGGGRPPGGERPPGGGEHRGEGPRPPER
jgi:uncharacterized protein YraI